jgi:hypothetical protein
MALRYVWSGAAGTGSGADWTNAHTTLSAAITAGAAGDTYYVAHDHAESVATALTLGFKGTIQSPDRVLCVNRAGSVPPVAADLTTGATITTTGTSNLVVQGYLYARGLTFSCGSGTGSPRLAVADSGANSQKFENCAFGIAATGGTGRIDVGTTNSFQTRVEWVNCSVSFGATGQAICLFSGGGRFLWRNPAGGLGVTGAVLPTGGLFAQFFDRPAEAIISGVDLSNISASLVGSAYASCGIKFINCKLHASVVVASTPPSPRGFTCAIGSHSSGGVGRNEIYAYQGTLTTETTIVRTAGASDGVDAYSWKIVTTSNNERDFPFECFEGAVWNTDTGAAKTLTVHVVTNNLTLQDDEIWLEVEHLGASGVPLATLVSGAAATVLTAGANHAASTENWTTTGLATPVKQKLAVTFTPQMVGPVRWRVKVGRASTTVYVCPKAELA